LTTFCAYREDPEGVFGSNGSGEGWETMLQALISAGFSIEAIWPIRTQQATAQPAHPIPPAPEVVIVCRARPWRARATTHQEFASALRRELPEALREIQSGLLAPIDLAQSSVGAGLAIFSRHSAVLAADGRALTVHDALRDIGLALDTFLTKQNAYLDHVSRFAVAWFSRFGYTMQSTDEARTLARMNGTTFAEVIDSDVLQSRGSRAWLVHGEEVDTRWPLGRGRPPLVWKTTHRLVRRLGLAGQQEAAALLAEIPPGLVREIRQLAYHLYGICDRNGWAAEAREYEELINAWSAIQPKAEAAAAGSFRQRRLFD
jgi:putative DNA methylase